MSRVMNLTANRLCQCNETRIYIYSLKQKKSINNNNQLLVELHECKNSNKKPKNEIEEEEEKVAEQDEHVCKQ